MNTEPAAQMEEDDFLPDDRHLAYIKQNGTVKFLLGRDGKVSVTDGWGTDLETDVDVTVPVSDIGELTRDNLRHALTAVQAGIDGSTMPAGAETLYAAGKKLAQERQQAA